MKQQLRRIYSLLLLLGVDPRKTIHLLKGLPLYYRDLRKLKSQAPATTEFPFGEFYPCLDDRFAEGGFGQGHYFHQDLLVARRIYLNKPDKHVDVGSRIDGFVAHVASFRPIEVFDIRPLSNTIPNIRHTQADLMAPIDERLAGYCDSLSCLHALEHFGLGRYGDLVNHDGHILGLRNLSTILKKGGKFYLSVPIGPQRIEFNAHRVFAVSYLMEWFSGKYHLDQFSYVDDKGVLHEGVPVTDVDARNSFGCWYGCGIFELAKL